MPVRVELELLVERVALVPVDLVALLPELLRADDELTLVLPLRTVDWDPLEVVVLVFVELLPDVCTRLDVVDDRVALALPVDLVVLLDEPVDLLALLDPLVLLAELLPDVAVPEVFRLAELPEPDVPRVALEDDVAAFPLDAELPEFPLVEELLDAEPLEAVPLVADDVVVLFVASYATLTSYAFACFLAFSARSTAEFWTATLALRTVNERSGYCLP